MGIDKKHHPNILMVEGNDDKHSVIELMGFHTDWPDDKNKCPVYVEVANGVEEILADRFLDVWLRSPRLQVFGILLDEDDTVGGRYQRIRQLCSPQIGSMPNTMPHEGLILENDDAPRFGVWIMPDNASLGDLETFLRDLIPSKEEPIWKFACEAVTHARHLGAGCREAHLSKSYLYTWLALQDPPGQSPGRALTQKQLDPCAAYCKPFVAWFKKLYSLPDLL